MKNKKYLDMLNRIIILPDNYYLSVSESDESLVSLCKISNDKTIIIEQFILESYDHNSIVELGLEIGEYID